MTFEPSPNTRAILLLTAPLIAGRGKYKPSVKALGAGEYRRLARRLRELQRQPADLLAPGAREIVDECRTGPDPTTRTAARPRLSPRPGGGTLADAGDLGPEPGGCRLPPAPEAAPWRGCSPGALRVW